MRTLFFLTEKINLHDPAFLVDSSIKYSVDEFLKEKNAMFTNNHITVQLSSDPFGIWMSLDVCEIVSTSPDCFLVPNMDFELNGKALSVSYAPTLCFGIYNISENRLKKRILDYFNMVSKNPLDASEITGDTSKIVWKTLGAVFRFQQTNPIAQKASTFLAY